MFADYAEQMTRQRGLAVGTLRNYERYIDDFLGALGDEPAKWRPQEIRAHLLKCSARRSPSYVEQATKAVRSFLRHLVMRRVCPASLISAVPRIAHWRLSSLPRALPQEHLERLLASCDTKTERGSRDRAILLLLARLGLRAGDARQLKLEDLNFRRGTIRVAGKNGKQVRLPLSQEVGDAVLHYLREFRPRAGIQEVFLRCIRPVRPLAPPSVSALVRRCHEDAETPPGLSRGAHALRHSAATTWLREGASLREVGDVLRHASLETTMLYAKVDVRSLHEIAQPWPEVTRC
jgi:site-specific recombinase XerD